MNLSALAKPCYVIAAAVTGTLVLLGIIYLSALSSIRTEGVRKENALEARYSDNQNKLSSYVITIKEQLQVADRKTDKLDQVLADAVSGRYDNELAAATPGESNLRFES